jgi:hypothetical protein
VVQGQQGQVLALVREQVQVRGLLLGQGRGRLVRVLEQRGRVLEQLLLLGLVHHLQLLPSSWPPRHQPQTQQ